MAVLLANVIVLLSGIYLLIGFVFSILFVFKGAGRIDTTAKEGTLGFKIIIIPGVVAFWPLMAKRWLKKAGHPPQEKNPHRTLACQLHEQKNMEEDR